MEIFAPLAGRMGMQWMREELEDLSFKVLNPEARNSIIRRFLTLAARNRRRGPQDHRRHPARAGEGADRGRCLWPREEALFDLAQDAGEGPGVLAAVRHLRLPRDLRVGGGLLPHPWRDPPALARGAGAVQGLHQPAEDQRLPVDPHHGLGPRRQAGRGADPHPRDARGGRGRRCRALVLPRGRAGAEPLRRRSGEVDRRR